jgi:hypothetical protein
MIAQYLPARMPGATMAPDWCARPFNAEAVGLRVLNMPAQIASVLHLRDEIDLSVHAGASSNFLALEKKETSWASLAFSILKTKR